MVQATIPRRKTLGALCPTLTTCLGPNLGRLTVYRHIMPCLWLYDAHNVRGRIVRRQAAGLLGADPGQAMRVRLTAAG